ncbi:hypothetical protein F511_12214 [Dorcoceras hygrometricum]|uniref:Uncharacterized protein n=1 Tax=Dorcoceras hygrometricum TaxID=472368 RepID=A0A2Z7B3Z3_9LAMI|nr:hypothetical protein F511_12214 [Dorcoceras hygrometricum]
MVGFLDIPSKTAVEMRQKFSGTDVLFRAPNKKNEMKMKYRLLNDIVAKALCAKASSFDVVTSEKFDLMVAISAGLKVFVSNFGGDGEHAYQVVTRLCGASVEQQIGSRLYQEKSEGWSSWKPEKEAGETKKPEKAAVEKQKKKRKKVVQLVKKQKVVKNMPVEAGSQVALAKSKPGISSNADSRLLAKLMKGGAKRKLVVDSSDSESIVSIPLVPIRKKHRTKRTKKVSPTADHKVASQPGPILDILAGDDKAQLMVNQKPLWRQLQKWRNRLMVHPPKLSKKSMRSVIDPVAKGKGIMDAFAWPNPVEEHCMLVLKSAWEDVSDRMADYDKCVTIDLKGVFMSSATTYVWSHTAQTPNPESYIHFKI